MLSIFSTQNLQTFLRRKNLRGSRPPALGPEEEPSRRGPLLLPPSRRGYPPPPPPSRRGPLLLPPSRRGYPPSRGGRGVYVEGVDVAPAVVPGVALAAPLGAADVDGADVVAAAAGADVLSAAFVSGAFVSSAISLLQTCL